ncbi:MAG: hypothetical protein HY303_15515 [Candidatus Wallbacteria bacterium]|nr:hypothetical protein [Candidatus Wallbacteria bacterium]
MAPWTRRYRLERALSGLLLAGFILLPAAFLYAFFQGIRDCCHQLSDSKFFEPMRESVSGHLLALLAGLAAVQLLKFFSHS